VGRRLSAAPAVALACAALAGCGEDVPARAQCYDRSDTPLPERIKAARVPTADKGDGSTHLHMEVRIWIRGHPKVIPATVGLELDPTPDRTATLHTHTSDGLIHDEGYPGGTLGQFFAVWGLSFGPDCVGSARVEDGEKVRMWVDGRPSDEYGDLEFENGQKIVISLGREEAMPTPPPLRSPGSG
jgi:hypothetical protein